MQLHAVLCYSYICDMIFIIQFLKSNANFHIWFQGHRPPSPSNQWNVLGSDLQCTELFSCIWYKFLSSLSMFFSFLLLPLVLFLYFLSSYVVSATSSKYPCVINVLKTPIFTTLILCFWHFYNFYNFFYFEIKWEPFKIVGSLGLFYSKFQMCLNCKILICFSEFDRITVACFEQN